MHRHSPERITTLFNKTRIKKMMHYFAPATISEATDILQSAKAPIKFLSGGTDLLVQMRAGVVKPETIIDLKKIPETKSIQLINNQWIIGAAVSGAEFNENPSLVKDWPGVAEGFDLIGSTQIQGRATLAGNLCNASPAADSVPAMIAAGVIANVVGPDGKREIPVEKIHRSPGKTHLADNEFILSFTFPEKQTLCGDAYDRITPRTEMDIAIVGVGVSVSLDKKGVCQRARVGLGAVAPTALLVNEAAAALVGNTLDEKTLDALGSAVVAACSPINDKRGTIEYRKQVASVLAKRVAKTAFQRAAANK